MKNLLSISLKRWALWNWRMDFSVRIRSSWYFDILSDTSFNLYRLLYFFIFWNCDIDFREPMIYIMICYMYFSKFRILINCWFDVNISFGNILLQHWQMNLAQHSISYRSNLSSLSLHSIKISQCYTSYFLSNNAMDKI